VTLQLANVTLDCADALTVGTFWSAALGRPLDAGGTGDFASIGAGEEQRTGWFFIRVPEGTTPESRVDRREDNHP